MGNAGSSSSSSSSNKKHKQKEKRIIVEPGKLEIKNHHDGASIKDEARDKLNKHLNKLNRKSNDSKKDNPRSCNCGIININEDDDDFDIKAGAVVGNVVSDGVTAVVGGVGDGAGATLKAIQGSVKPVKKTIFSAFVETDRR